MYLAASGDGGYNNNGSADVVPERRRGRRHRARPRAVPRTANRRGTAPGSGCSPGQTKPSWQHDTGCTTRTAADVSAVAWQVAEYDTYGYGGWFTVGGTSAASPMIAAVFGLAGNASAQDAGKKLWTLKKKHRHRWLNDITTGSNGSCGGSYLCTAGKGYDGPTGWGTPKGVKAF